MGDRNLLLATVPPRCQWRFSPRPHRWIEIAQFKRMCADCHREEWVMGTPYPQVGEPAYSWQVMHEGPFAERRENRWWKRVWRRRVRL